MAVSEGLASTLRYKAYASGALAAATEAAAASDPGSSGGRFLRNVNHSLNLKRGSFRSNERRSDRQVAHFRHTGRRVEGSINGEFSPATYFDFIEAVMRGTKVSSLSKGNADYTSVEADSGAGTYTFAGGNPVSDGFRVGDVVIFSSLSEAANNSINHTIVAMSGTNGRVWTVDPAPTTMTADSAFSVARPGRTIAIPSSSFVSRLFAFEDYDEETDISRLFTECRALGFRLRMPPEGPMTFEAMFMGRGMSVLTSGSAPFFASPSAETTTNHTAAVNGLIQVGGSTVGVVTGLDLDVVMAVDAPSVVGQEFVPAIVLGVPSVTGSVTALFESATLLNNFLNEDETSILARVDAGGGSAPDSVVTHLPRIKFSAADMQRGGEGAQPISLPFQALKYLGSGTGIEATTIRMHDTAAS